MPEQRSLQWRVSVVLGNKVRPSETLPVLLQSLKSQENITSLQWRWSHLHAYGKDADLSSPSYCPGSNWVPLALLNLRVLLEAFFVKCVPVKSASRPCLMLTDCPADTPYVSSCPLGQLAQEVLMKVLTNPIQVPAKMKLSVQEETTLFC